MFHGTYRHNLDTAGRFVMPQELRDLLGAEFYIIKGLGCLCIYTHDWAVKVQNELAKFSSPLSMLLNPDVARLHRHFFSGLEKVTTDKQNRVQLAPEHRRYAGIINDVVVCGCGDYIELWSPDKFDEYEKTSGRVEDLVNSARLLMAPPAASESGEGDGDGDIPSAGPA